MREDFVIMPAAATANRRASWLDKLGIATATACALHCLLLPLVMGFLPMMWLTQFVGEDTEWIFISVSIVLGLTSLLTSYRRHHRRLAPFRVFVAGLLLILSARFFYEDQRYIEIPMVVTGAIFLAAGHAINYRLCQTCVVRSVSAGR